MYLFFSEFCKQVPIVHSATWKTDDKPLMLVRAMQACGALFVKTGTATAFIDETLVSTRDTLIQEFVSIVKRCLIRRRYSPSVLIRQNPLLILKSKIT